MTWSRFPVLFDGGDAHQFIIAHDPLDKAREGLDVVRHLSLQVLTSAHPRPYPRSHTGSPKAGFLSGSSSQSSSPRRHGSRVTSRPAFAFQSGEGVSPAAAPEAFWKEPWQTQLSWLPSATSMGSAFYASTAYPAYSRFEGYATYGSASTPFVFAV